MLLILKPISYIQLSLYIVILPFSLLHALEKISLVAFRVEIPHLASPMWFFLVDLSFIVCSIGHSDVHNMGTHHLN